MSWFTPQKHPDEKYFIFGRDGGSILAAETKSPLLGQIPLIAEVGDAAEKGLSIYSQSNKAVTNIMDEIVEKLLL